MGAICPADLPAVVSTGKAGIADFPDSSVSYVRDFRPKNIFMTRKGDLSNNYA